MTAGIMGRIAEAAPRHKGGGIVGAYYLLTILVGAFVLFFQGTLALAGDLLVTIVYIGLTILFYEFSKKRLTSENRGRSDSVAPVQSRNATSHDLLFHQR